MARRTQVERSQATVGELTDAAERLFADRGYAATSVEDVVRAAGVTRGALYHHFDGKSALFAAVFQRQQEQVTRVLAAESGAVEGALSQVRRGCEAFLEAVRDPVFRQVSIVDAPNALGWSRVREIESHHSLALLREGLAAAEQAGDIVGGDVEARVALLFGALCEAGVYVAAAADQDAALEIMRAEVNLLLDGFVR